MRLNLPEDYSLLQVIIILGTYFFASSVKGVTGLGFSTVCLPFMVLTVGLKAALPLLIIPSLASNLIVMRQAGHFRSTFHRFWLMLLTTVIGVFCGLGSTFESRRHVRWCNFRFGFDILVYLLLYHT